LTIRCAQHRIRRSTGRPLDVPLGNTAPTQLRQDSDAENKPNLLPDCGQNFDLPSPATHAGAVNLRQLDTLAPSSCDLPGIPGRSQELVRHIAASTGLSPGVAARVVAEVAAYFMESPQDYVRRRHRELQADRLRNDAIFTRIGAELAHRPVAPPSLSARQLRRIVYS
jgi:hypothetical protein